MTSELIPQGGAILRPRPLPERGDPDGKTRRQGKPGLNRGMQGTGNGPCGSRARTGRPASDAHGENDPAFVRRDLTNLRIHRRDAAGNGSPYGRSGSDPSSRTSFPAQAGRPYGPGKAPKRIARLRDRNRERSGRLSARRTESPGHD